MTEFTTWRSLVDGAEISEIPDSDLTQYTLTDPDNRITITSSNSYEARLPDGGNEESRLYDEIELEELRYVFDMEVLDEGGGGGTVVGFGWSDSVDSVLSNTSNFIGAFWQDGEIGSIAGDGDEDESRVTIGPTPENEPYEIEIQFDLSNDEFTVNAQGIGSDTRSIPTGVDWSVHYAQISWGQDFSDPGFVDYDLTNNRFEAI